MSNDNIEIIINKLESFWKLNQSPILQKLNPGIELNENQIPKFTGIIPKEVFDLYKWKNGVGSDDGNERIGTLTLFELGIFLTFNKVISYQKGMSEDEFGWDSKKLPLFESGREYFLIECDPSKKSYGRIIYHSIKAVEFRTMISIYDSLETLFTTIYECNKNGAFHYDQQTGYLIIDGKKSYDIQKKLNPLSDYWKLFD